MRKKRRSMGEGREREREERERERERAKERETRNSQGYGSQYIGQNSVQSAENVTHPPARSASKRPAKFAAR
jgi:hypothetical protein